MLDGLCVADATGLTRVPASIWQRLRIPCFCWYQAVKGERSVSHPESVSLGSTVRGQRVLDGFCCESFSNAALLTSLASWWFGKSWDE